MAITASAFAAFLPLILLVHFGTSTDITLLCSLAIYRRQAFLLELIEKYVGFIIALQFILGFAILFVILQFTRFLLSFQDLDAPTDGFPAKPMFFPCRTSHIRLFPAINSFDYSYLWVGYPVGWKGSSGGLISADVEDLPWYLRWFTLKPRAAWWSVNSDLYLGRGHVSDGLAGKLREWMEAHGHSPNDYAFAYLFTAARFFNYQSNPVSVWNLYSTTKELTAVILEVNNTFEERHIYLMRPQSTPLSKDLAIKPPRFLGKFQKEFYVSTFNSRLGHYSISTSDALFPNMTTANPLPVNTTIGLCSSSGRPKLIARISSTGPAVDPSALCLFGKISFLSKWWWVGFLTIPRTLYQAWILFFNKKVSWSFRPEPRAATMCRPATADQIFIENIFRRCLRHTIFSSFPEIIHVKYIAAGIHPAETETMKSGRSSNAGADVEIRVLTPLFYTRLLYYTSLSEALLGESQEGNQTVSISNYNLTSKFSLPNETSVSLPPTTTPIWQRGALILLNAISVSAPPIENCETGPEISPRYIAKSTSWRYDIQAFLQSKECTDSERNEWLFQAGKLFLSHHLTLGSVDLLDLLLLGWKAISSWGIVRRIFA
ncbi:hypothetical protein BGZ60DRAFT_390144 [Tricladium varicosporioides]|nr:hypothetical protein BGZ60DRAFT_390144 [Hymenoscyphus varicosporioides]